MNETVTDRQTHIRCYFLKKVTRVISSTSVSPFGREIETHRQKDGQAFTFAMLVWICSQKICLSSKIWDVVDNSLNSLWNKTKSRKRPTVCGIYHQIRTTGLLPDTSYVRQDPRLKPPWKRFVIFLSFQNNLWSLLHVRCLCNRMAWVDKMFEFHPYWLF